MCVAILKRATGIRLCYLAMARISAIASSTAINNRKSDPNSYFGVVQIIILI